MKITHIITDLDTGGAEIMLYKLLVSLRDEKVESLVVSLMRNGPITQRIKALGVKVETLGLKQGDRPSWQTIDRLRKLIRTFNPDVVQGWIESSHKLSQLLNSLPTGAFPLPQI
jgi:hypothetical protein